MVPDLGDSRRKDFESVISALQDEDCRDIIESLAEPKTAQEISQAADVPLSSTYRKLDQCVSLPLLREETEYRRDGHQITRYHCNFDRVSIRLTQDRAFELKVQRLADVVDPIV